jgi:hypothetical protein
MKNLFLIWVALFATLSMAGTPLGDYANLPYTDWASGDKFPMIDISVDQNKNATVSDFDSRFVNESDHTTALALKQNKGTHTLYVGPGREYTTIQAALTAIGNAASAAEVKQPKTVIIEPGTYDESLTIPKGRIITLVAQGTVILGDGAGANWASTTPRSITMDSDNADVFGSDIKPSLTIMALPAADPTTTFVSFSGSFRVSGAINLDGDGLSHNLNLNSVVVDGTLTKTATGLTNLQGYRWYQKGAVNAGTATILERCFECEFDALVTVDGYNAIINSELNAGMTVTTNFNTMPPSGFFNTTFFGTFTGPANSLKLDASSNYFFTANSAALGGSASKVIISALPTTSLTGVLTEANGGTGASQAQKSLNSDFTQTGNTAATETTVATYTIPANTLSTNGNKVIFEAAGTFAATGSTDKQIKILYGASTIFDSGSLNITAAHSWSLKGKCMRTGATSQKCDVVLTTSDSTVPVLVEYDTAAETLSGTVALAVRANGTNANDVVRETFDVQMVP